MQFVHFRPNKSQVYGDSAGLCLQFQIIAKQDSRFIADVKLTREKANKA